MVEHELDLLPPHDGRPPLRLAFVSDLHLGPVTPAGGARSRVRPADEARAGRAAPRRRLRLPGRDRRGWRPSCSGGAGCRGAGGARSWRCSATTICRPTMASSSARSRRRGAARAGEHRPRSCRRPTRTWRWSGSTIRSPAPSTPTAAFAGAAGTRTLAIALVHAPEGYPFVRGRGARLAVCGHTHGGQVALPGGPIVVPGPLGRRWPAGLFGAR